MARCKRPGLVRLHCGGRRFARIHGKVSRQPKQPGLRIPITAERALFDEAVVLGREVVWLQTFGERFGVRTARQGRRASPTTSLQSRPAGRCPVNCPACRTNWRTTPPREGLRLARVLSPTSSPEVWAYEVSGKNVLSQWWSYRRQDRSKPPMGDRRPHSELRKFQAETLALRIYDRASRPFARAYPAGRSGAATGRSAGSHRGWPDDRQRHAQRRRFTERSLGGSARLRAMKTVERLLDFSSTSAFFLGRFQTEAFKRGHRLGVEKLRRHRRPCWARSTRSQDRS